MNYFIKIMPIFACGAPILGLCMEPRVIRLALISPAASGGKSAHPLTQSSERPRFTCCPEIREEAMCVPLGQKFGDSAHGFLCLFLPLARKPVVPDQGHLATLGLKQETDAWPGQPMGSMPASRWNTFFKLRRFGAACYLCLIYGYAG